MTTHADTRLSDREDEGGTAGLIQALGEPGYADMRGRGASPRRIDPTH